MMDRLVDPRFGIVRRLHDVALPEDFPPTLHRAHAVVSDARQFSPWPSDDRAGGFAFWNPDTARAAALGEAVERTCGNLVARPLRRASFADLVAAGEEAVDPESLALFSDEQHAAPGFPFVRFDRDLAVLWTEGRKLDDVGQQDRDEQDTGTCWVPASLVWVTFSQGAPTRDEPRTHAVPYAGVATGPSRAAAERSALLELAERDAFSLGWHRGDPLVPIEVPSWLEATTATNASSSLRLRLFHCPSDLDLPVVAALLEDDRRRHRALGVACREAPRAAAEKATAEAFQLLTTVRILDDPRSPYHAEHAGAPGSGVKPWREDRAYRGLYRPDWRDAWDLLCHLQIHLDPAIDPLLAERLAIGVDPAARPLCLDDLPRLPVEEDRVEEARDALVRRFAERGHPPVAVDLETLEIAALGLAVTRVVAPGLYGNAPAAFPYLGGERLARAVADGTVCRLPPPYA